jgi:2',3'-cyclic-nucleotide 2'-phosphodiesterase / 3'-nucleotidase / 5'-nucleotidase
MRIGILLLSAHVMLGQDPRLTVLGTYRSGQYNLGAAEIVAHDPASRRLFVVNGASRTVDILDMSTPANLRLISQITMPTGHGVAANSVAVRDGVVAVAVEADPKTEPGSCVFFDTNGRFLNAVRVGALPDMVTFTPDGRRVLVANEAEPSVDYLVDPEGSISIVDISGGVANLTQANVRTAGFSAFTRETLEPGVRVFGPRASVAQDLEPEYITVSPDSRTAYVVPTWCCRKQTQWQLSILTRRV